MASGFFVPWSNGCSCELFSDREVQNTLRGHLRTSYIFEFWIPGSSFA